MSVLIKLKNEFAPPQRIKWGEYHLEVLAPKHNEIDFTAWSSSISSLKGVFGPRNQWPSDVCSLESNLKDLKNHLREFEHKEAFTYTILDSDYKTCLGCLYIRGCKAKVYDCRVDFWFRDSHKDLEASFYLWVKDYLKKVWSFKEIALPGRNVSWEHYYDLTDEMCFWESSEYQEKIKAIYEQLKDKIKTILPKADIQHIGSSAVPGIISKGDLDIYIGVKTKDFENSLEKLIISDYKIKENTYRSSQLCMFEHVEKNIDVGLQLVDENSIHRNFLTFRDALLRSKKLRDAYNQLKIDAKGLSPFEYRKVKSKFIINALSLTSLNEKELHYWNSYLQTLKDQSKMFKVEAGIAGNEEIADELLSLYLLSKKKAGSSLIKDYEQAGDPLPEVGNHWIILDSKNEPKCIVKTIRVETYQFDEVPEEVAIAEGEGDLSLEYWRKAHIDFFKPFLEKFCISNIHKEMIITEFYEVVYK